MSIGAYRRRARAIAPIAVSILMWAACSNALAVLPAPTGHRQPNVSNVPPSVLRGEQKTNPEDGEFDKKLNICRGC